MNLAAMPTPTGMTAMFLDLDRDHTNLDLLDNANVVAGRTQSVAAVRAKLRDVVVRRSRRCASRTKLRSCLGCPGCPPMWRLSCPAGTWGLGGLTMSEEGGLEEVEESLRAAASCVWSCATVAWSWATAAVNVSTCTCKREQLAQGVAASFLMPPSLFFAATLARPGRNHCVRSPSVAQQGRPSRKRTKVSSPRATPHTQHSRIRI